MRGLPFRVDVQRARTYPHTSSCRMRGDYVSRTACSRDWWMGGIEKLDPALLHSQIQVFARLLHAIEAMTAAQLKGGA